MALMQSWWQPIQQKRDATAVKQGLSRVQAAQTGSYGAIADRWNPNNYGSVESRQMPGLFGPMGMANPEYRLQQQQQAAQQQFWQRMNPPDSMLRAEARLGLRRRLAMADQLQRLGLRTPSSLRPAPQMQAYPLDDIEDDDNGLA